MAEYLFRDALQDSADWDVCSAGLIAGYGMPASLEAVQALQEDGMDLHPHHSRPLVRELVDSAALIVVMTAAHRDQICELYPNATEKTFLLKSFSKHETTSADVADPIGEPLEVYRSTRDEIKAAIPGLMQFVNELDT